MFGTIIRLGKPAIVELVTIVLWILLCTGYVQVTRLMGYIHPAAP